LEETTFYPTRAARPHDAVFAQFSTTDPDRASEYLSERYRSQRCRAAGAPFRLEAISSTYCSATFGRVRLTGRSCAEVDEEDTVVIARVTAGKMDVGNELRAGSGDTVLFPRRAYTSWSEDLECQLVALPGDYLRSVASQLTGARDLRFLGPRPLSSESANHWVATTRYLETNLTGTNPLMAAGAFHALAAAVVADFPNTANFSITAPSSRPPGLPKPVTLRRAAEFIHANVDRRLTLAEVATAASVSPRALQYAFRRHFGTTPMEYHRLARLEAAHRELLRPGHGTAAGTSAAVAGPTVTGIAAKWGFLNAGRFSGFYTRVYGVNPSETLRRVTGPYSGA
jgi:AraC-like DNA-binding protein